MKHLNEPVRSADLLGDGGFVSGAGVSLVASHGLGIAPRRENVILTPRANTVVWVTAANASQISISTSVSGTGTDWKAFI